MSREEPFSGASRQYGDIIHWKRGRGYVRGHRMRHAGRVVTVADVCQNTASGAEWLDVHGSKYALLSLPLTPAREAATVAP